MSYNFKVNEEMLSSDNNVISGSEILEMSGHKPVEEFDLFVKIKGREFEPVQYNEKVDLANPGIENFKVSHRKSITFNVDDEKYTTDEIELTPLDIFKIIGLDPSKFYLKQIKGHLDISYKNDEGVNIDMLGHLKFITCKREPATVS